MSEKRFSGKVAIVTGSSQGLGYAIAKRLGEEGATVLITSNVEKDNDEAVRKLKKLDIDASCTFCDVSKGDDNKNLVKTCIERYGRLDIAIANAGTSCPLGNLLQISEADYDKLMDTNLKSGFWLAREAEPYLEKTKGTMIFIASILAHNPVKELGMYSITKTAILAMVKVLAVELANKSIRVNAVSPGACDTDMMTKLCEAKAKSTNQAPGQQVVNGDDIRKEITESIPLKRFCKPSEIGAVVAFLASDDASYMTGETIVVAGGQNSRL